MLSFFRLVLANLVAMWIVLFGVILMGVALVFVALAMFEKKEVGVPSNAVLVFDISMNIPDAPASEGFNELIMDVYDQEHETSIHLLDVVNGIEYAAKDDRIKALFIYGNLMPAGYGSSFAALHEVREAIEVFKATGKPVLAYMENASFHDYYLMSVADKVYQNPFGNVEVVGFSMEMPYFGVCFQRYGIGVQVTKAGKYKSATEIFTEAKMSEAEREQGTLLIDDMWRDVAQDVVTSRKIPSDNFKQASSRFGILNTSTALKLKLIDEMGYWDNILHDLEEIAGRNEKTNTFNQVSLGKYVEKIDTDGWSSYFSKNQVAVVYAEGEIVDGGGLRNQIGGDSFSKLLRELRQDADVKAVVLRVNSPGGSAYASEIIQREVQLLKNVKPVVVSFGSVAASGGYWISAYSDKIFADPTTVTGSIGVFGLLFNVEKIAKDYGIFFDGVKSSPLADIGTLSRPKTPTEMAIFQHQTNFIYNAFLYKVAEGRDMPLTAVTAIAGGRVWSGIRAKEIGLVDEIGGLKDAIAEAAALAKLEGHWDVAEFPDKHGFVEELIKNFLDDYSEPAAKGSRFLSRVKRKFNEDVLFINSFNDPQGVYARMPFTPAFN
ncbi:MAG: signal peptide peptidase SppA [Verrucomicrobia bacterium CG_4_10_14_3_um_filter_43_23]|nr:MAG: signal peptide peptidase SppA [Verrucomicrobia bacterium CG1_02_43_26]PIP58763.1 MAG: signal peptide peptidase SppA [Verrucomicrobia bacterium CG22_combo_CG10-13_8_21_14_all_43_17]PIX57610.1 MAG: signal peptide peptidase SppA [Verrucomicrobia bacterium CG_4_10_14_3_um_filter_43_23]PIY61527.1 MAG: signal peptide peptidase SppA [Verrucomicrobia bacterium CG_4_10_14_0_8_um_filter_43_34]PJA44406.1 MAG: signal peptide peptidase SppA [Verrucomicrobia bacterium CG_4_9_14_3_um_filter_43_20]